MTLRVLYLTLQQKLIILSKNLCFLPTKKLQILLSNNSRKKTFESTYTWTTALQTTPTGGTITGFSNAAGAIIAQTLINTGTTAGVVRYTITPTANSCVGTAFTVDVTVNPTAQVKQHTAQIVCHGSSTSLVSFATTNTGGSTTYSCKKNPTSLGWAASGTCNKHFFPAVQRETDPVIANIMVT